MRKAPQRLGGGRQWQSEGFLMELFSWSWLFKTELETLLPVIGLLYENNMSYSDI